jgi:calcium release-activated calcium channel protein 1
MFVYLNLGKSNQDDQRLHNLFYRKSKLESVNETSALLSGFAIVSLHHRKNRCLLILSQVAIVELSLDAYISRNAGETLLICYAIVSCLLVGVHLLALLMSMCILPELKSAIRHSDTWINNENKKPLSSLNIYIEIAWLVSTGLGLFLFILELGLILWIKMSGFSQTAAIAALVTLCIVGCPFILFAVGFYILIARTKVYLHQTDLETIERGAIARGLFPDPSMQTRTTTITEQIR